MEMAQYCGTRGWIPRLAARRLAPLRPGLNLACAHSLTLAGASSASACAENAAAAIRVSCQPQLELRARHGQADQLTAAP